LATCNGGTCAASWYGGAVSLAFSATDTGSGVATTRYTLDGTDPTLTTGSAYATPISMGASATVKYRSWDVAGNAEAVEVVAIELDGSTPTVGITCNGGVCSSGWYGQGVDVVLSSSDAGGSGIVVVIYTLDGSTPSLANGTRYTTPFVLTQAATVQAVAFNGAGTPSSVATQTINIDTAAPSNVAVLPPANGASVTGTSPITTSPIDNVGVTRVRFYLDGVQLGSRIITPWKWNWNTTTATKGTHALQVQAEDAAGNATRSPGITVTVY
jgi:hypothetical protein